MLFDIHTLKADTGLYNKEQPGNGRDSKGEADVRLPE